MRRVVFGLVLLLTVTLAPQAFANDRIVVDDDWPAGDFCNGATTNSIESGVETANAGDTVFVCRGTYNEMVTIEADDSDIRVRGQDADEVILDGETLTGMGFYLTGGVTGVIVERFTVRGYLDNIVLDGGANGNRIRHNFVTGPSGHDGIRLSNAHNNSIERNIAIDNGTEVNGCGIDLLAGSSGNIVRRNFATLNDRAGIRVMGAGTGNVVRDNELRDNGRAGILNNNTTGTLIEDNDVQHSLGFGTELGHGIHVLNSTGITVRDNTTDRNMADGIFLENADTNTFRGNESEDNGRDGIRADSASMGNTIRGNEMEDNAEHDCHDDSLGGGTAGTANFWINNEGESESRPGLCRDDDDDDDDEEEDDDD
jgi:parallel beta-helix repeat protein